LSSLAIVFPNADLPDRVDQLLNFIAQRLGFIRLGASQQLLQCDIMTACGGGAKVFRSVANASQLASTSPVNDDKTQPKDERKKAQVKTAGKKSNDAKIIKLADKTSNMRAITFSPAPNWTVKRRLEYIGWAREVVKGLRGASPDDGLATFIDV
jgi:hypothetical protein